MSFSPSLAKREFAIDETLDRVLLKAGVELALQRILQQFIEVVSGRGR